MFSKHVIVSNKMCDTTCHHEIRMGPDLCDMAAWNAEQVESFDLFDFEELLAEDVDCEEWVGQGLDVAQVDEGVEMY